MQQCLNGSTFVRYMEHIIRDNEVYNKEQFQVPLGIQGQIEY